MLEFKYSMSDSDEEITLKKRKSFKLFNEDESDDDTGAENSNSQPREETSRNSSPLKSKPTTDDESHADKKSEQQADRGEHSDSSKSSGSTTNDSSDDDKKYEKNIHRDENSNASQSSSSSKASTSSRSQNEKSKKRPRRVIRNNSPSSSSDSERDDERSKHSTQSKAETSISNGSPKRIHTSDSSDDDNKDEPSNPVENENKNHDTNIDEFSSSHNLQESANVAQKSNGKFSLITESDLESENDVRRSDHESANDDELSTCGKKSKKLHKKKSNHSKKSAKSNGLPELADSSESENGDASPKHKSTAKSNTKVKPAKAPKKSTKKEDPLLAIRSETQRLIREGRFSLPYHQPKQRTLHEFLQRKTTFSIPLHATTKVLKEVCRDLRTKEKQIEDFYKSESDHSDTEARPNQSEANTEASNIPQPTSSDLPTDSVLETITPEVQNHEQTSAEQSTQSQINQDDQSDKDHDPIAPIASAIETSPQTPPLETPNSPLTETPPDPSDSTAKPDTPMDIPDSDDFQLRIEDSCDITTTSESPKITEPSHDSVDFSLALAESASPCAGDPPSSEQSVPQRSNNSFESVIAAGTSNATSASERLKSHVEALLSKHNIKLPPIKLDDNEKSIEIDFVDYQGIRELKKKLSKHVSTIKPPKKGPLQINIVSTQKDPEGQVTGVTTETLTLPSNDTESEFANPKLAKPGAKHAYFKEKMLRELINKKEATWKQYQSEKRKHRGSDDEEGENTEDDDEATCEKLNFEPYRPEEEPDDDELIEDDIVLEEKTRDKNCFLDEEAEVSCDEEDDDDNLDENIDDDSDTQPDEDHVEDDFDPDRLLDEDTTHSDTAKDTESPTPFTKPNPPSVGNLFKYNTTGSELENKLLGLESISQNDHDQDDITASQVFGICSGKFTSQGAPQLNNDVADTEFFVDSQNNDDSQNICLTLPDTDNTVENEPSNVKNDEAFAPSDTSDNEEIFARKKKARKIEDSEDESDAEPANESDPENDDAEENLDQESDEDDEISRNIEAEEFGYNSEEELVPFTKETVAREFFEDEAELSESEWGSEDENEKDLDKLEKEEGDDDDIDNEKLKEELGKIHMRQLLDDDQHDVRLLKEMLLEDGELHGAKRQRKFQWKNLGDGGDFFMKNNYDSDDDENNANDEEETEEHWRKIRHERETFLSQQENKSILETSTETSEISFLKLPTSTKIIDQSVTRASSSSNEPATKTIDYTKSSVNSQFRCGSFLTRSKLLLSKIVIPVSDAKQNVNGAKNSRNFVFGAKSPTKDTHNVAAEKTEKRKSTVSSTSVSKKIKLSVENNAKGINATVRKGLLAQLALTD